MINKNQDFKSLIVDINVDIILKSINKAPERCARNLLELGLKSTLLNYQNQKEILYQKLLALIKTNNISELKKWFLDTFLTK